MGPLFIPQVMRVESYGDDDADWEKLLIRPPELSDSPTSRDI
jgi:hypothetical protein